jgi:hypothetical protein
MKKPGVFDYVKSINKKNYMFDLSGYNPFLTNRTFAGFIDTIMLAEEMNQAHALSPALQYDFYYYSIRKGNRFDPINKVQDSPHLEIVMEYYTYSKQKAIEALRILTPDDIEKITKSLDKGGNN